MSPPHSALSEDYSNGAALPLTGPGPHLTGSIHGDDGIVMASDSDTDGMTRHAWSLSPPPPAKMRSRGADGAAEGGALDTAAGAERFSQPHAANSPTVEPRAADAAFFNWAHERRDADLREALAMTAAMAHTHQAAPPAAARLSSRKRAHSIGEDEG